MAKFRSQKNSLAGGRISPTAMGRTDIAAYAHACKTLHNAIPKLSGGAYRRPGSIKEARISELGDILPGFIFTSTRFFPFVFNDSDVSLIVVGAYSATPTLAVPVAVYENLANDIPETASVGSFNPLLGSVTQSFGTANLYKIRFAQIFDTLFFVEGDTKPMRIVRNAAGDYTLSAFDAGLTASALMAAYPFLAPSTTSGTLNVAASTGSNIIVVAAGGMTFDAGHIGAIFRIGGGAFQITSLDSSTQARVTILVNLTSWGSPVTGWQESAWSNYRGWPRTIAYYAKRIVYGGTRTAPDTFWFTEENDINQLSRLAAATYDPFSAPTGIEPYSFLPGGATQLSDIKWMVPRRNLLCGMVGREFLIGSKGDPAISAEISREQTIGYVTTAYGSRDLNPAESQDVIYFADRAGGVLEYNFSNDDQNYKGVPISALHDDYPKTFSDALGYYVSSASIARMVWDQYRKTLWVLDAAGNVFACTRDRQTNNLAWHTHSFGDYVSDVLCLPNPNGLTTDLWLVVTRDAKQYLERVVGSFDADSSYYTGTDYTMPCLTDSSGYYNPFPGNTITGLDHLDGRTVEVTIRHSDGLFCYGPYTVASGSITIPGTLPADWAVTGTCVVGLPYTTVIEPVRPEAGSQIGTSQGAIKRIHQVFVRFYKTLSAKVGKDLSNLETVQFRTGSTPMAKSPELFTGDKAIYLDSDYDRDGYMVIVQDKALPMTVVSVSMEGVLYD